MITKRGLLFLIVAYVVSNIFFITAPAHAYNIGKKICKTAGYFCLQIKRGESWQSLWPNSDLRHIVMSINRINIPLHPGMILAVPRYLSSSSLLDHSPFPQRIDPPGQKLIIFSPNKLAWAAYTPYGEQVRWGAASGGADWCQDIHSACRTKSGKFSLYRAGSEGCKSTKFPIPKGGAPMPYCMFFNGGQAFHGSYDVPGYNASHGCVRLLKEDARWIHSDYGYQGVRVIVTPYGAHQYTHTDSSQED